MNTNVKKKINKNPLTGLEQEIEISQIDYINFETKEARIKFKVYQLDKNKNRVNAPMTSCEIWRNFNNSVKVNHKGEPISNPPIENGETPGQYQARIEELMLTGIGQFDYWIGPLVPILSDSLEKAIESLHLENEKIA